MNTVQRKYVHVNSIDLSYLQWAPPPPSSLPDAASLANTHPVLLLHGLADHAGVWQSLGDRLSLTRPVVAPDLRGHGESSKPDSGYGWSDIIADLTGLMDHLGWSSAHILGHSWSGKIACIWATRSPQRFQKIVLVDPAFTGRFPRWTQPTFPLFYNLLPFLKTMGPFDSYDDAEAQAKTLKQYRQWTPFQAEVFRTSMEQDTEGRWRSKFCTAARDGVFADFTQISGLTQPIAIPTLFIRPRKGLNPTAMQLQLYKRFISPLEIQEVPGNHWAFLVDPDTINPVIADFLAP